MELLTRFIFILMTVSALASCDREEIKNGTIFYWDQTGCADPWGTGANDSNLETSAALKAYLKKEGISAVDIVSFENILEEGVYLCFSCGCITGNRIILEVKESDEPKMIELGFIKK